jgi:acyl-CoA dehydrogenase
LSTSRRSCSTATRASAIQVHGAAGVSQDFPLAYALASVRTLRFADGPDEVHKNALARNELKRQAARTR